MDPPGPSSWDLIATFRILSGTTLAGRISGGSIGLINFYNKLVFIDCQLEAHGLDMARKKGFNHLPASSSLSKNCGIENSFHTQLSPIPIRTWA
ncbi:hypothetical protein CEXT_154491 [Caerostris extrusa]|uniref:Uncharacterized protein n=1 Tax=Caerostris extrusa TaxID=172846 RepID=A0AAV4Y5Y0_CAEEX|nr:hypothetical protein CEXT_154491 [Caerostris extrusa]